MAQPMGIVAVVGPMHSGKATVAREIAKVAGLPLAVSTIKPDIPNLFSFAVKRLVFYRQSQMAHSGRFVTTVDPYSDIKWMCAQLSPEENQLLSDLMRVMAPIPPTIRIHMIVTVNDIYVRIWAHRTNGCSIGIAEIREHVDAWDKISFGRDDDRRDDRVRMRVPVFVEQNAPDLRTLAKTIRTTWTWNVREFKAAIDSTAYGLPIDRETDRCGSQSAGK